MFLTPDRFRRTPRRARSGARPALDWCESLESRQLLSGGQVRLLGLTDANSMVEFAAADPAAILRTIPITGLSADMTMLGIDFRQSNGRLYGFYTFNDNSSGNSKGICDIDPRTGAASNFRNLAGVILTRNSPSGLDFDIATDTARVLEDPAARLRRLTVSAASIVNTGGLAFVPTTPAAFVNEIGGAGGSSVRILTIDASGNQLRRYVTNEGFAGSETIVGALGVDAQGPYAGLDYAEDNLLYAALRVGGTTRFGTISGATGAFTQTALLGDGSAIIRELAAIPLNDAPVLSTAYQPALASVPRNAGPGEIPGTLIRDLVSSGATQRITDANPYDSRGIAIIAQDDLDGLWQYTLDGSTWIDITAVSASNALLLPVDDQARVRFIPNDKFTGSISEGLVFRAWDRTEGSVGGRLDATSTGGMTPFSADTRAASILVVSPPTFTDFSRRFEITDKQTAMALSFLGITWNGESGTSFTLEITISPPEAGVFTAASLAASGFARLNTGPNIYGLTATAAQLVTAAHLLVFDPAENLTTVGGTSTAFFAFALSGGGFPTLVAGGTSVASTSVNDAPTNAALPTSKPVKVGRNIRIFLGSTITERDPGQQVTVTIRLDKPAKGGFTPASLAASGFIKVAPKQFRFVGAAAAATTNIRKLRYAFKAGLLPAPAQVVNFTVRVSDGLVEGPIARTQVRLIR